MRFRSCNRATALLAALIAAALSVTLVAAMADPASWRAEWPRTDFSRHTVPLAQIKSGGPPKDGIPSIATPRFERLNGGATAGWAAKLGDSEPVISLVIGSDARAYPLSILIWHEIANDVIGGTPVAVTYCPLCNASLVFEPTIEDHVLDFGTTGKLRNSDLVMYDRQTESWWQQFGGDAIAGVMSGKRLHLVPSRLESFGRFRQRFPDGQVPQNVSRIHIGLEKIAPNARLPQGGNWMQGWYFGNMGDLTKTRTVARVSAALRGCVARPKENSREPSRGSVGESRRRSWGAPLARRCRDQLAIGADLHRLMIGPIPTNIDRSLSAIDDVHGLVLIRLRNFHFGGADRPIRRSFAKRFRTMPVIQFVNSDKGSRGIADILQPPLGAKK